MPDILIEDIDDSVLEKLRKRAEANGRTLESELHFIIKESTEKDFLTDRQISRKIKDSLRGRTHSDSSTLLRKDRSR